MTPREKELRNRLGEIRGSGIDIEQLISFSRLTPDQRLAVMEEFQAEIEQMRQQFQATRDFRRGLV